MLDLLDRASMGLGSLSDAVDDAVDEDRVTDVDETPTKLKPFFTFYGGKWRAARKYPAPEYETIIEPFAGAAGYSVRHAKRKVILVERDPVIAATWRYLLHVSPEEVLALPDVAHDQTVDDLGVCQEARWLIGWWLNGGSSTPKKRAGSWMRRQVSQGGTGWASGGGQLSWSAAVRRRVAAQIPVIRHWQVIEGDYTAAPDIEATWFVDPPYQQAGKHYLFGSDKLDFMHLAEWCRSRRGQVMVCENVGAEWLPFVPFIDIKASEAKHGGKVSHEALWTNRPECLSTGSPYPTLSPIPGSPMARPRFATVRHIVSTLKGGVDTEIFPKSLIVGDNASGKDRIPQAVQLALSGSVYDIGGKDTVSSPIELLALGDRQRPLTSYAVSTTGEIASFSVEATTEGGSRNADHRPFPETPTLFPLRDLQELLSSGGDEARRRFFLEALGRTITRESIKPLFPDSAWAVYESLEKEAGSMGSSGSSSAVDRLTSIRDAANKAKLAAAADIRATDKLVNELSKNVSQTDLPPTAEQIERYGLEAEALKAKIDALPPAKVTINVDAVQMDVQGQRGKIQQAQDALGELHARRSGLSLLDESVKANIASQRAAYSALRLVAVTQAQAVAAGTLDRCVVCDGRGKVSASDGTGGLTAFPVHAHLDTAIAADMAQRTIAQVDDVLSRLDAAEAEDRRAREIDAQIVQAQDFITASTAFLARAEAALASAATTDDTEIERRDLMTRWQSAMERVNQSRRAFDAFEGVRKARAQKAQAEADKDRYTRFVSLCDEAVGTLLGQARGAFVVEVASYMPEESKMPDGGTFELRLTEGKRDVCRVGLIKSRGEATAFHTALSGAEWGIVTTAVACALARIHGQGKSGRLLPVIVMEERDYDPKTLAAAMRALADAPAQILWTSTKTPHGRVPKGWEVIEASKVPRELPTVTLDDLKSGKIVGVNEEGEGEEDAGEEDGPEDSEGEGDGISDRSRVVDNPTVADGAPEWVLDRGHTGWAGRPDEVQAALTKRFPGMNLAPMSEFVMPGGVQRFWLFPDGIVVRVIGNDRAFIEDAPPVPAWAQRPGRMLWSGPAKEFKEAFAERFAGAAWEVKATKDMRRGQWRLGHNGSVVYVHGGQWTLYSGTAVGAGEAPVAEA